MDFPFQHFHLGQGYDDGDRHGGWGGEFRHGDFRGGWAQVSTSALSRLASCKVKFDASKAALQLTPAEAFFLHPNKDHLVQETFKQLKIYVEENGFAIARVKLDAEQRKRYKVTRKVAYMVGVARNRETALAECKAVLEAGADALVPVAPAAAPPVPPAPAPAHAPAPVVTPATNGKKKPSKSASKSVSKKT